MYTKKNNIYLNDKEILALIEVIYRAKEIKNPSLMYYTTLLQIDTKLTDLVENHYNDIMQD